MSTTKRSRSGSRKSKKSRASSYKTRGQIVRVDWHDAWGRSGWSGHIDDWKVSHSDYAVTSVGVVLTHDKKGISIAQGLSEDGIVLTPQYIPAGMISKVTKL